MSVKLIKLALSSPTVTVSGQIIAGSSEASVFFRSDGTTDESSDGVESQINASTDWVIPNAAANGTYEVRATLGAGTASIGGSATGTWLSLGSDRNWGTTDTGNFRSLTIEVRVGFTILDSATYTLDLR